MWQCRLNRRFCELRIDKKRFFVDNIYYGSLNSSWIEQNPDQNEDYMFDEYSVNKTKEEVLIEELSASIRPNSI
jgi:hypothetical protein